MTGKYWKEGIESTIVSHCGNEASMFTPKHVTTEETFDAFLGGFMPGSDHANQRTAIKQHYKCRINFLGDWNKCASTIIRDSTFTCNTRFLHQAYPDITHMMRYVFPLIDLASHGSDMAPLFTNTVAEAKVMLSKNGLNETQAGQYAQFLYFHKIPLAYKTYFASFAAKGGDPNVLAQPGQAPSWPIASDSDAGLMQNVMTVRMASFTESAFVTDVTDRQNAKSTCDFWTGIAGEVMGAPPQQESSSAQSEDEELEALHAEL